MTSKQLDELITEKDKRIAELEADNARLAALYNDAIHFVGMAGKILEQMEEFWNHGTPIAAGSLLAIEFQKWGKRVMEGPLPSTALRELLKPTIELLESLPALGDDAIAVTAELARLKGIVEAKP